jgi:hypothetical protein
MYLVYADSPRSERCINRLKAKADLFEGEMLGGISRGIFFKETPNTVGLLMGLKLRYREEIIVMEVFPKNHVDLLKRLQELKEWKPIRYKSVEGEPINEPDVDQM